MKVLMLLKLKFILGSGRGIINEAFLQRRNFQDQNFYLCEDALGDAIIFAQNPCIKAKFLLSAVWTP